LATGLLAPSKFHPFGLLLLQRRKSLNDSFDCRIGTCGKPRITLVRMAPRIQDILQRVNLAPFVAELDSFHVKFSAIFFWSWAISSSFLLSCGGGCGWIVTGYLPIVLLVALVLLVPLGRGVALPVPLAVWFLLRATLSTFGWLA
jgi:hypothetical protein